MLRGARLADELSSGAIFRSSNCRDPADPAGLASAPRCSLCSRPIKAVVFIIVQQGLFGLYLGCSFAPNHKGMPILDAADQSDFLRRQALTSCNVRGGWLTDFALGGLNYQIEHHLFPSWLCRREMAPSVSE